MLIFSLLVSVVLTASVLAVSRGRGLAIAGAMLVGAGLVGFFVACLPALFPAIALSGLLMLIFAGSELLTGVHSRSWLRAVVAILIGHGLVELYSVTMIWQRAQLREHYPVESIGERLAYEKRPIPRQESPPLQSRESLDEFERRMESEASFGITRAWALKRLHEGVVSDFIEAPGFGVARVLADPTKRNIELPDAEPIPQIGPESGSQEEAPGLVAGVPAPPPDSPTRSDLEVMHQNSAIDFVNPRGFGYVIDGTRAAGFRAHRFGERPEKQRDAALAGSARGAG
jgi:hypothetical protein